MAMFRVTVEKMLRQSGTIEVSAKHADDAAKRVSDMMHNEKKPLHTCDPRIQWDEPEYEDFTFAVTGDVE